jgi:hypothetical protein
VVRYKSLSPAWGPFGLARQRGRSSRVRVAKIRQSPYYRARLTWAAVKTSRRWNPIQSLWGQDRRMVTARKANSMDKRRVDAVRGARSC